jgi:Catalytic LigB subunit of aromatic ring-opening dioxygenase
MAELVGVLFTSHGGCTTIPSSGWPALRSGRTFREEVPFESQEEMDAKWARTVAGKRALRQKLAELRPDVLVIVGDDQEECFGFSNFPALAVYLGEQMAARPGPRPEDSDVHPDKLPAVAPGHPALARHLLTGFMEEGFDPAFMMDMPRPERGMSHAVMLPLGFFTDYEIPTVPVLINAYYAPQVTARRSAEVGRALRRLISSYPEELRVVVIGSGGLWHTPRQERSWLNEEFDLEGMRLLSEGDVEGWIELFDGYRPDDDDPSQDWKVPRRGVTGLPTPSGPQGGSRETLCWIAAAAVIEGERSEVLDYIPIYASPVGNAFAFWQPA